VAANKAGLRLTLDDGTDLADRIDPRLLELTLVEKRGGEADELSLTLHNHDGQLVAPATGRTLHLALGWESGEDVVLGLVDKGAFRVDEVEERGPPDIIQIRARSADFTGPARQRRVKVWKDTTLGAVLRHRRARGPCRASSPRSGRQAHRHPRTAQQERPRAGSGSGRPVRRAGHMEEPAIAVHAHRQPHHRQRRPLPAITLTRQDGWSWSCRQADRTQYDGAEAQWHDPATGQRRTHKTGGTNRKRLKRTYASQAEAQQAATAEAARRARSKRTFTYELAMANMQLQPNAPITLAGWTTAIDAASWLVESVETAMGQMA
jgi:phage protein D